jgi:hypothetical protein
MIFKRSLFHYTGKGSIFPFLVFYFIFFKYELLFGQPEKIIEPEKKIQIGFQINSTIIPPAKIVRYNGDIDLITRTIIGYEGGITFKTRLNNFFSLNGGVFHGNLPYYFEFELNQKYIEYYKTDEIKSNHISYFNGYKAFRLLLSASIIKSNNLEVSVPLGLSLAHYPVTEMSFQYEYGGLDTNKRNDPLFLLMLDSNFPYKMRLNYQGGINLSWRLKNQNDLGIKMFYNYSPEDVVEGYYGFFMDTPHFTFGKYSMSGSYAGLGINYTLTGRKKIMELMAGTYKDKKERKQLRKEIKEKLPELKTEELFDVNHLSFSADVKVYQPGKYKIQHGNHKPKTMAMIGNGCTLSYLWNFNSKQSFAAATNFSFSKENNYDVKLEPDPPVLNTEIQMVDYSYYLLSHWGFFLSYEHRFLNNNAMAYNFIQAGLNIERYESYLLEEYEEDSIVGFEEPGSSNFYLFFDQNPNMVFTVSPIVSFGRAFILKNKNIFELKGTLNIALANARVGTFELYGNSSKFSTGTFEWKPSYFGISAGYKFTGSRKIIRNRYY